MKVPFQLQNSLIVGPLITDGNELAVLLRGLDDGLGFLHSGAQRLFAKHVAAMRQTGYGVGCMVLNGGRNQHQIGLMMAIKLFQ